MKVEVKPLWHWRPRLLNVLADNIENPPGSMPPLISSATNTSTRPRPEQWLRREDYPARLSALPLDADHD